MKSIRARLLIVLLAVGLVPMVAVVVVTNLLTRAALEDSEREKIAAITHEVSRQIKGVMRSAANDLVALRGNRVVTGADTPLSERVAEMRRLVEAYQMFDDITLYDAGGLMVKSTTDTNHPEPMEKTRWFVTAREEGRVVTSRPHRVVGHDGLHLKIYMPLRIVGEAEDFVLRARLKFQPTWDLIDGVRIGENGEALLLDARGTVIAGRDKQAILRPFTRDGHSPFWSGEDGLVKVDGEEQYFHSDIIEAGDTQTGEPWVVVCLRPRSELMASVRHAITVQTLIVLGVIAVAGIVGVWIARRFAEPVVQASAAARRVSEGDLEARIPERGALELRQLAESFNLMVDEVRNHRGHLEAMVESRTEKLEQTAVELEGIYAQLRAAYEAAKEGILVVGADGNLIAANQRVIDYFGLEGDLDGMTIEQFREQVGNCFYSPDDFAEIWETINEEPSHLAEGEWELIAPRERVLSVYSAPVENSSGERIARLWTFHDVTNQRQLQRSLEQAQKMEAVGRLAGGVAHDFNNLLTGIIGNLSLVEMSGEKSSKAHDAQFISAAKRAGQRAAELVKKLLGFSRQSHLELAFCDANAVADDVEALLSTTLDPKISLEIERSDGLWAVEADPTQIEQVVMNMCVNSRDAFNGGAGKISLKTRNLTIAEGRGLASHPQGYAGDFVVVTVSDDGMGIPEEVLGKIFEPFFTTKEQGKGTGLGLATSYGIVQQHGGWIECESTLGLGTSFHIFLPRKDRPVQRNTAKRPRKEVQGGKETILLVDDEAVVRSVAEGILKHHGYKTLTAGDGVEALEVFAEHEDEISLVLLDLTMPNMSGRETLAALRDRYGDVPVVVCSGYLVDLEGFEEETGYRPDAAVQKPYNVDHLAHKVRDIIDQADVLVS